MFTSFYLSLISSVFIFTTIIFILMDENKSVYRVLPLCVSSFLWQFGNTFRSIFMDNPELTSTLAKLSYIAPLYMPVGHVLIALPYLKRVKFILYTFHLIFCYLCLLLTQTDLVISGYKVGPHGLLLKHGPYFPLYTAFVLMAYMLVIIAYIQKYRTSDSQLEKSNLLKYCFLSSLFLLSATDIAITSGVSNHFPLGSLFISIFLITMFFLIKRSSLFSEADNHSNLTARLISQNTQKFAHDVRQPFMFVRIALKQIETKENISKADIQRLRKNFEKHENIIHSLTSDLMIFGSERANKLEVTNIHELALNSWKILEANDNTKKYIFKIDLPPEEKAYCDRIKVARLFTNLLKNAREAVSNIKKDGIYIQAKTTGPANSQIQITVKNEGSFIPISQQKNIFERFATKGKTEGNGIGLAICYEVVKSHKGTIWCESSQEEGTKFHFTLPRPSK